MTAKVTMTKEVAAQLRAPFKPEEIGKLPKVFCKGCRDAPNKVCANHKRVRCGGCNNSMTEAHLHIDYVGHAETTDRFLEVDAEWNWEPMATNGDDVPYLDGYGGMWIKLTIAGVTRLGYGHADGKKGPDAIKEAIGDALRNAGMRFGVAIDLWGAKFERESKITIEPDPEPEGWPTTVEPPPPSPPPMVNDKQHKHMHALWRELGYSGDENRDVRLQVMAKILGLASLDTSKHITEEQADNVIAALIARRDHVAQQQQQEGAPQ
jgi:hypothetical protein